MGTLTMPLTGQANPPVWPANPDEMERIAAALTIAFSADPACRWLYRDPAQYLKHFPEFVQAFGGNALQHGSALLSEAGAALWFPPGEGPDEEALIDLIERSVGAAERTAVLALFSEMARWHPVAPHWYLPLIGVEVGWQGRGYGTAMIRPILDRCDAEGLPAYLEATSPRNRPLYERLGFKAIGVIDAGGCPPIVPMLRRPAGRK